MNTYTEQEAKERFCCGAPFIATAIMATSKGGEIIDPNRFGFCAASKCMAWRWEPLLADDAFAAAVKKAAAEISDDSPSRTKAAKHVTANRTQYGLPTAPFRGFCGLAGTP